MDLAKAMTKPPVNPIDLAAATWAAKADGTSVPPEDQAAFDAWLAEDPRHLGAFLKVQASLAKVERLGAVALQTLESDAEPWFSFAGFQPRRMMMAGALAASCLAVIVFGIFQASVYNAVFDTAVGRIRVVSLPDGSKLTLNTDSKVAVRYSLLARDITLDRGEALFDVAKNKWRPFVVQADGMRARAVGTSFVVSHISDRPKRVTVREGVVEVGDERTSSMVAVRGGERAVEAADGHFTLERLARSQVAKELAWLSGHILFRNQTLASAVKEFERYSAIRIVIADTSIARRTVTGTYLANDPTGFAQAVALLMDLRVEKKGNTLQLTQKGR